MASITLKNITKTYEDGNTVISDLNLEIKDKEFIILVGPSGCGKSTTLRMIAGLEEVTSGDLFIGDKRVNDDAPKDRDIAMVFQSYALYPHMTVYKNMAFALELRKVNKKEIDRKVREVAKILEIEDYLNRKPRALSGGQRQRVALGRAMVRDPAVFLLDEPLSNLDAKLRTEMRSQIIRLHQKLQTTFVYVTHDQAEAMTMADRIVVMKDGFIQQVDTPSELYEHPCNMFVAGFIGTPKMNFVDAVLVENNHILYLEFSGYTISLPERMQNNEKLRGYLGKKIVFGIRPEDLHANEKYENENKTNRIDLHVEIAEMMGSEIYLYGELGGEKIIANVPSNKKVENNSDVALYIDTNRVHIFDKETEELICD